MVKKKYPMVHASAVHAFHVAMMPLILGRKNKLFVLDSAVLAMPFLRNFIHCVKLIDTKISFFSSEN